MPGFFLRTPPNLFDNLIRKNLKKHLSVDVIKCHSVMFKEQLYTDSDSWLSSYEYSPQSLPI